ncbi:DUF2955 domain-containing protein [Aureitalea marina]|uniref:DUF2955 domain-containing protein n=1 Tax=Aureitalea marina TaxID=930804 RepID=A0A2S7KST9_9FLAO|nr:DUF2955 domain-containing protein [Aureitalea marina]PQB05692.1 hypothetical protein BST85_12880 [Aureitalea marina]
MLTLALAVTTGGPLSYVLPVLSLPLLTAPGTGPGIKQGLSFMLVIALSVMVANLVVIFFLDYPVALFLVLALLLFYIFYSIHPMMSGMVKTWLLMAIMLIPTIAIRSDALAQAISGSLILISIEAMLCVWIAFYLFPSTPPLQGEKKQGGQAGGTNRYKDALFRTWVVLPVLLLFFMFEITASLLVLVFIALLAMQAGIGTGFKAGKALILGNLAGGLLAISTFEILTVVPNLLFFLMLSTGICLVIATKLFSSSPYAPLFGMAFSTYLLIIGSTTASGEADAGSKVWTRVIQIMMAVIYIAIAFGFLGNWNKHKSAEHA